MLWLVLLMFFCENSRVQGECTSNTHYMGRIRSKSTGTFSCRDCFCEDPLGWICMKKQGDCMPDIGPTEYFCKAANSEYLTPIDEGEDQKGCLICKCKGKGKAWSCRESPKSCKSFEKTGKSTQLFKAPANTQQNSAQPAPSSEETTTGDTMKHGMAPQWSASPR